MNKDLKLMINAGIKKEVAVKILETFYLEGATAGMTITKFMPNISSNQLNKTLNDSFNHMINQEE